MAALMLSAKTMNFDGPAVMGAECHDINFGHGGKNSEKLGESKGRRHVKR